MPGKSKELRDETDKELLAFLQKVQPFKELLFGKLTAPDGNVTKEKKEAKWLEIQQELTDEGMYSQHLDMSDEFF
jgi:hypothetical protein